MLSLIAASFAVSIAGSPEARVHRERQADLGVTPVQIVVVAPEAPTVVAPMSVVHGKPASPARGTRPSPSMSVTGVTILVGIFVSIPLVQWQWSMRHRRRVVQRLGAAKQGQWGCESRLSRMFGPPS